MEDGRGGKYRAVEWRWTGVDVGERGSDVETEWYGLDADASTQREHKMQSSSALEVVFCCCLLVGPVEVHMLVKLSIAFTRSRGWRGKREFALADREV